MKAEHRKELQTNVLADRMGRLVQGMRSGPEGNSLLVWTLSILTVGLVFLWYYAGSSAGHSGAWVSWYLASSGPDPAALPRANDETPIAEKSLTRIDQENPGTLAARSARFQKARQLLQDGMSSLYSARSEDSVKDVKDARKLYEGLVAESSNEPLLAVEALVGVAKAEEALAGVPGENASQALGDVDRAVEFYRRAARLYPETYLGMAAARHLENFDKNPADVDNFYQEMRKQLAAETPKKPSS